MLTHIVTVIALALHVDRSSTCLLPIQMIPRLHSDNSWFKHTCEPSVPASCSLLCCWPIFNMEQLDWQMGQDDALQQMLQTFQNIAPLLDNGLKLAPNPEAPKRQRRAQDQADPSDKSSLAKGQAQQIDHQKLLLLMGRLLLKVDRDLQVLQRETTFIIFFSSQEQTGILPLLLQEANVWHQSSKEGSSSLKMPLRQVLLQTVVKELIARLTKLTEAPADSPLLEVARKTNIVLENNTIPFMEWDALEKRLKIAAKTPVSLAKMGEHLLELQEGFKDANLIMKFHSLPTKPDSVITPWRLQMSSREDRTYDLMLHLAQSQIWTLIAASLKQHNLYQSSLAANLEQSLGLKPPKGQGKGKSKTKGHKMPQPKQEK